MSTFRNKIASKRLQSVTFSAYSGEELLNLSVKEITNPRSFDELGHPTTGGLYDSALGPSDRDELCTTCYLGPLHCPGHMGHVALPLPVFNPLFFKLVFKLLRGACLRCYTFQPPRWIMHLVKYQLLALDHGLISLADSMADTARSALSESCDGQYVTADNIGKCLREQLSTALREKTDSNRSTGTGCQSRHVHDRRQQIIQEFLRVHLLVRVRKCYNCKQAMTQIRMEHNAKILTKIGHKNSMRLVFISPQEARTHLRKLMGNEGVILKCLFGMLNTGKGLQNLLDETDETDDKLEETSKAGADGSEDDKQNISFSLQEKPVVECDSSEPSATDLFFLDLLPVISSKFRPITGAMGKKFDNPQTANLTKVLKDCRLLRLLLTVMGKQEGEEGLPKEEPGGSEAGLKPDDDVDKSVLTSIPGKTDAEKLQSTWIGLQAHVNNVVDSNLDRLNRDKQPGIKQLLEKKEGLFRKHMMGKRVNYAARSVISPDPYINSDEIGIPEIIATKLTYPQPVTDWNVSELRRLVINGPNTHPGALFVENEDGSQMKLSPWNSSQREAAAKQLLVPKNIHHGPNSQKKVHRHISTGDIVLLNRQPTLHKPSIMAHKVRILPGEKTLRLHYSACKTYNADFDGDEMNVHFPQNEIGRAEASTIANTSQQYLVPKDGTPLGGLIQDHMVAGVKMTVRGRFFKRAAYQQLVYNALTDHPGLVRLLPPAVVKPLRLWSGKQVISTLLLNIIPRDAEPINFNGKAKISNKSWGRKDPRPSLAGTATPTMTESEVVVRGGQLVCGVLDKANYGNTCYGLVHCCFELYGGQVAVQLLSCLGRLFTTFLQQFTGFTLGVRDILVTPTGNSKRSKLMRKARKVGREVVSGALGLEDATDDKTLQEKYEEAHRKSDDLEMREIDLRMKSQMDRFTNQISTACLSTGLEQNFPDNNLQLMVLSGAKGSQVNCMQISCLLGQIELEGRRPPLMASGRSLPSFLPYDPSPRAGGYVDGRFLTGIRPQEYFFHCMAGREGLVDTAIKTSRSGYLQRCIIKHLEGLMVNYDLTVRDSDGCVVQFLYGGDGLDIPKTPFLKSEQFPFLLENSAPLRQPNAAATDPSNARRRQKMIDKWCRKNGAYRKADRCSPFLNFSTKRLSALQEERETRPAETEELSVKEEIIQQWRGTQDRQKFTKNTSPCPEPVHFQLRPDTSFGAISEKLHSIVEDYLSNHYREQDPKRNRRDGEEEEVSPETRFRNLIYSKYRRSLCEPGEAVGLLAAQSIGEPSTQMTLNTFHFAGRGEMNVTLGIPRLVEILMVASSHIKTPRMDVPLLKSTNINKKAARLKKKLTRVVLAQVVEDIHVYESYEITNAFEQYRLFRIRINFLPYKEYKSDLQVDPANILYYVECRFLKRFSECIKRKMRDNQKMSLVDSQAAKTAGDNDGEPGGLEEEEPLEPVAVDMEDESDGDDDGELEGAGGAKSRQQRQEEIEYETDQDEHVMEEQASDEEGEDTGSCHGDDTEVVEESNDLEAVVDVGKKNKNKGIAGNDKQNRINNAVAASSYLVSYDFDSENQEWCEFTIKLDLSSSHLDMMSLFLTESRSAVLHEAPGIQRCIIADSESDDGGKVLKTSGVNLREMCKHEKVIDMRRLYTNNIHAVMNTYGVEAACRVIIKEIQDVFKVYAIYVDPRHLSLVADYMTLEGVYKPFNRIGLESNSSPLQKMSFESTMHFLKQATTQGVCDTLQSPSARLVVGRVVTVGTGCFDLIQPLT